LVITAPAGISLSSSVGTAGQVLSSNGSAQPTWINNTIPYVPTLSSIGGGTVTSAGTQYVTYLSPPLLVGTYIYSQSVNLIGAAAGAFTGLGSIEIVDSPGAGTIFASVSNLTGISDSISTTNWQYGYFQINMTFKITTAGTYYLQANNLGVTGNYNVDTGTGTLLRIADS
jgi:hypothetical protein